METSDPRRTAWESAFDAESASRVLAAIESDDPEAGTSRAEGVPHIEGYVIDKHLGGGAGGEVYRAIRVGSDHIVAIKILRQRLGESPSARRAWSELDLLAQLRLSAIPNLLDHGEYDGRLYLVTEFIDGVSLLEFAKREDLDVHARVDLLSRVADALQSVHEFAVIHRDIKPENILINSFGQPVLVDLGVAMLLSPNALETLTRDGAPIGTPAFMSPEQARGETRAISTRSDVYGLGATAYELLTGHTPHGMDETIHEAIRRVAHDAPRNPRELCPSLPKSLAAVLRKAVAARPEDRYESAGAMAADLRRWMRGEPVEASGVSVSQRITRLISRHPIITTAAACIVVAALTLSMTAASVWWMNMRPNALEIDPAERAWARLISHSGRELYRWDQGAIRSAELVDRPAELGGGQIALIGFGPSHDPVLDGQLCAFDVSSPGTMLWASGRGVGQLNMPTPISMNKGDSFAVWWVQTREVFAESPGEEIIAYHRLNTFSATCVRVYALDGRVLFEVWHDGVPDDMYWMARSGLLILCGFNSEGLWVQRSYVGESLATRPIVVFALKPEFGKRHHEWIRTPGGGGTFEPEWYQCLLPPDPVERLWDSDRRMTLLRPSHETARPDLVHWLFLLASEGAQLYLTIDSHGQIVDRFTSDGYRAAGNALPDPATLYLAPLPPLLPDENAPAGE